jgi:hypothetical protein
MWYSTEELFLRGQPTRRTNSGDPGQLNNVVMTDEQARQDHLRLQRETKLSTNNRQIMVSRSGHAIYLDRPEVVVRSIAAVVTSAKDHSHLSSIE